MSISDERLIAYADGELSPQDRASVEADLARDPAAADRLRAHREVAAKLAAAFAEVLHEPLPERLTAAARAPTRDQNVVTLFARRPGRLAMGWLGGGAIAASLLLGVFIGRVAPPSVETAPFGSDMRAQGPLAKALDTQLASTQGAAVVRIGVSFRSIDGPVCRTFDMANTGGPAGLACRQDRAWIVRMALPAYRLDRSSAYRTAGSSLPAPVVALAQSLAAGAPFDAQAEQREKANHWN